jgi:hypothetical protein
VLPAAALKVGGRRSLGGWKKERLGGERRRWYRERERERAGRRESGEGRERR